MSEKVNQVGTARIAIVTAAVVIIIAGMREAATIIVPFLVAIFIAIIGTSPVFWLKKRGVPSFLSILLVVLVILGIGFAITAVLGTSLNNFSQELPFYQQRLQQQMTDLVSWLEIRGIHLSSSQLKEIVNPGAVMQLVATLLAGLGSVLTNTFLIMIVVIFILLEVSSFPAKLRSIKGNPEASLPAFKEFTNALQRYLAIKTSVSAATGLLAVTWVTVLGVDFPLLWGLLAFLLNYVPTIGSILATIPVVLLALIQLGHGTALLVALGYLVINFIFSSIIEPRFMGRGLGLSTLVVFLSLVFWGWVLGPVGMLLSVPLTMTVKIALDSNEETRWIAILLSSENPTASSPLAPTNQKPPAFSNLNSAPKSKKDSSGRK